MQSNKVLKTLVKQKTHSITNLHHPFSVDKKFSFSSILSELTATV